MVRTNTDSGYSSRIEAGRGKFDDKAIEARLRQSYTRRLSLQELYIKANVKDNRYLFF